MSKTTQTAAAKPAAKPTSKPGIKTTEFWFSTAAALVGVLFASGTIAEGTSIDKIMGMAATVLAGLGYTVSRGMAKKG